MFNVWYTKVIQRFIEKKKVIQSLKQGFDFIKLNLKTKYKKPNTKKASIICP